MVMSVLRVAAFLCLLPLTASPVLAEDARHRNFSPEEIKAMAETRAVIQTSLGNITLRFLPEVAPNHVDNFLQLAKAGFYDDTTFHRVIPGFMIQGGDPKSKSPDRNIHGTGGPDYRLKAEFNSTPHRKGTLSMARSGHPDSAGSQFFICVADAPFLDGKYTVFGEVVDGMDVAERIVSQKRDGRDNPITSIPMTVTVPPTAK